MIFRAFRFGALGFVVALLPAAPALAAVVSATPERTPTFDGVVWAAAYHGDTIYVGGDFTTAVDSGRSVARTRLAAIDARTGALLGWAPSADGRVRAITAAAGSVFVAGDFGTVSGVRRDSLARLDPVSGAVHGGFAHGVSGVPYALAAGHERLYVGGTVSAVDGQARSRLAAFDLASGALDGSWRPAASGTVHALAVGADRVYLGGKFGAVDGAGGTSRLAAVHPTTGAVDAGFRARDVKDVFGLAVGGSTLYAAQGGPGGRLTAYATDGGGGRWNLGMDGDPQTVAVLGDAVYFGGHFDNVCRSPRTGSGGGSCVDGSTRRVKLAAAAARDGTPLDWGASGNGSVGVRTLAASGRLGKLCAGGAFTKINGASQPYFAQFGR